MLNRPLATLVARGETQPAFAEHCIPPGLLRSAARIFPIFGLFGASPAGRIARLSAAADFHHRLLVLRALASTVIFVPRTFVLMDTDVTKVR